MVRQPSVLLIEDSRSISFVLKERLEKSTGGRITPCFTAHECRDVLENVTQDFDAAIVDLNLPGASNGELLDLVVAAGIPAVVFTATFDAAVRDTILARGGADYIIKDHDSALDMVQAAVERLIGNQYFKLLVVEDGSSARHSLVSVLKRQRFQVVEAKTGKEALELLEQQTDIALVLTDHYMPDMDGYELTRRIRRTYKSEEVCVIGISSSADRLLSARFLKAGASDFVYRPYVVEELQCRIDLHIQALSKVRQLRMAAFHDYLTGLYNRRYFYDEGPNLIEKCLRKGQTCSVAMVDIDHFKRINDTYGHNAGDEVLKHVTSRMTARMKDKPGLVGRVGGEEFGILLPGMDDQEALAFCEALRQEVSNDVLVLGGQEVSITISIGLAHVSGREYFHNYINAADQCLYLAKYAGRNRVYSESHIGSDL
ncbi:response regulator [Rhizobium oryziradicis]|uniref:diguanylate cyclase n=1 Tax=Rhizobium oryziradicis TaxID=1867956 RepID=A0A1Q8ZS09_9HYPH|nr:response regulator [Rhizobium oryziradicis]OLP44855.1 diguanylate cyclase response regulator [Rhizobium oryziradicis]